MGQNSITMFTNDSGSAGGPIAYVSDVFQDVTDTPSTNVGWSSTLSNNPLNNLYGNNDFPRFGPKTLWIKDLVLEPNRSFWINGEPTYRVIWNEPFPSAQGYVYGNVQILRQGDLTFVKIRTSGDGFGVGGVFARCMFIATPTTSTTASATISLDGVSNSTSVDFSSLGPSNPLNTPIFASAVHNTSNESYQIHDFRIAANQSGGVLQISGVVVYSENSTLSIDQFPGTTYNNKTQSKTTANTTLPLPSWGSSLGGRSVIFKNAGGGYSLSAMGVSTVVSVATGTNGSNLLNLTAGTGASFLTGNGIISSSGTSTYVGTILSISTDALTVFPLLPFGISNAIYRYFQSGQSLAINASLNVLAYTFGVTEITRFGFTGSLSAQLYLDPSQNFICWGSGMGATYTDSIWPSIAFGGASGFLRCEGYFSGAEIEWVGMSFGVLSGTMCVNGLATYSHSNIGFTGSLKKTVFLDAGPGWNSFSFFPGSSHVNVNISRINLYQKSRDYSASYGILAQFDTLQAYTPRAVNATFNAPGCFRRLFADQIMIQGASLTRVVGATWPGGVAYACGLSAALSFQYWGSNFALLTGMSMGYGSSLNFSIDTGSNLGSTSMNQVVNQGSSNTFHSVSMIVLGGTLFISGLEYYRTYSEMQSLQNFSSSGSSLPVLPLVTDWRSFTASGSWVTNCNYTGLWRRVGDTGEFQIQIALTGVPTSTQLFLNLPFNWQIDYSKNINDPVSTAGGPLGLSKYLQPGQAEYAGMVLINPNNYGQVKPTVFLCSGQTYTPAANVTQALPFSFGTSAAVQVNFRCPIQGWGGSY